MQEPAATLSKVTLLTSYLDEVTRRSAASRLSDEFAAVWEVSNLELRLALAAAGKGVSYLSDRLLKDTPGMHAIEGLPEASIPRDVGIYFNKHEPLSRGARHFLAICDRHFA